MNNANNVIEFYVLCNKLKDIVRTGWKNWNVKRERVESVAEHIYGVQMLAIAMWSEYKYDINLKKVLAMISVHELEEIIIGDLTFLQISKEEKNKKGHEAIKKILCNLIKGKDIENLILEFDERKTNEAYFAYQCDKLECDIQCKLYDEENCVDLLNQPNNEFALTDRVKEMINKNMSWSEMWIKNGQSRNNYDKNFLEVSNFALKNKINN